MKKDYSLRRYVLGGVTIGIVIVFLFRLWDLQFMSDEYKAHADSNAFLNRIQYPSRGAMYDRNGKLLVFNQPSYDITVILREIENLDTLDLCRTLNITPAYFLKRIEDIKDKRLNPGYSQYTHQTFMTQLSAEECGVFQEKLFKFHGFYIQRRTIRQYVYNFAAHALGDIGEVSMNDINEDGYYTRGDYIGKQGIEKSYEKYLRGEKGVEVLLRDAHGRIQGHYKNGQLDKKPISGKNLTLGLDIELQALAEKLMSNKLGSIVAIEPKTGEILCMVSAPNYAPSVMVGRQRGKNHVALEQDPLKPLFNRAIMGTYPPGSTFKPAQGMIFLQEEIVNTSTTFPCYQGFSFGGMNVGCHSHGSPVPFIHAISTSCNSYFCWGFFQMMGNKKYGTTTKALTVWKDYMVSMGFGYRLGIDLPGEQRGLIPNAAYYDKIYGPGRWTGLRTIHTAIGQGEILLTPVQIANLAATIANRGYYLIPHIVREIEDNELESNYTTPHYTMIAPQNYEYIVQGMRGAVIGSPYGATCYRANIPGIEVCGKTGTAQNRGKDHSVFMGFAPMNNPQIAISVYVENAGYGATWAVPMAALLMEKYINGFVAPERAYQIEPISNTNLVPHGVQKH